MKKVDDLTSCMKNMNSAIEKLAKVMNDEHSYQNGKPLSSDLDK